MEPIFLEEGWYRTNWNYFLTPRGVFVLRLILLDKEWIYFYGFVYNSDNNLLPIAFKSDNEELKQLITVHARENTTTEDEKNPQRMLMCNRHTRLILYNVFCTNITAADNKEITELNNIVDLILS